MLLLIWLVALANAEYYGVPEDMYNFYKNAESDELTANTRAGGDDDHTHTMNRLAKVSANSLQKLDKQELQEFKEALTMLMETTEGETAPLNVEYDLATRTSNTRVLTPEPSVINNILKIILDKLETRTEAINSQPTRSSTISKSTRTPANYSEAKPTVHTTVTKTARRWVTTTDLKSYKSDYFDALDSTTPIATTDETDTVLAQTVSVFDKTEPVTSGNVTDTLQTETGTILNTVTDSILDDQEASNETLPLLNIDDIADSSNFSDAIKDYYADSHKNVTIDADLFNVSFGDANISSLVAALDRRGGGYATPPLGFRRAPKPTKPRRRKTGTRTKKRKTPKFTYSTTTTKSRRKKTRIRTYSTPFPLDVPRLIELITNLTLDYGPNITSIVNKTLQDLPILTCPTVTVTTTEEPTTTIQTTTSDPYGNLTGTIMGKCFVCGLETPAMPRHARCADAFAGDFIPLVPVLATARKMLASYRKYCRWMNVPKYIINETDPRSMWGRWTGGCSVRWIDISGIYTQRSCRNRHRAVMGKHWVSKRMAKLEMALQRLDSGCIISPMASLVPLSRGISLYARFHACVCTGSWCNSAPPGAQCVLYSVPLLLVLTRFYYSLASYLT